MIIVANLLEGEEMYEAAQKHKNISANDLIDMLIIIAKHLKDNGEIEKANLQLKIAVGIINTFKDDFLETRYFKSTIYESATEQLAQIEQLLND